VPANDLKGALLWRLADNPQSFAAYDARLPGT
jgi:hypothetical protein